LRIYGSTPAAVETMIAKGTPEKGMPGWLDILGRDKVRHLVGYIISIQGTNPADAKAPQGEAGKLQ
jgi:cytochrome c oxidase cbb3-type subunit 3